MRDIPIYQLARVFAKRRMIYKIHFAYWATKYNITDEVMDKLIADQYEFAFKALTNLWSDISQLGEKE